jgi:methyl-accepting chemotaxis protein
MTAVEQIEQLNLMIENVLDGNLYAQPDMKIFDENFFRLAKNISMLIEAQTSFATEAQVASTRIISASEDLSLTLEENNQFMNNLYQDAKKISSLNDTSYNITAASIDEIKRIISDIELVRSFSQGAIAESSAAQAAVTEGVSRIGSIVEIVGALDTGSRKTVEFVDKFSESTKEISKILKVVHDISRETEILSFNASIESRRAGVQGRGFGVIAVAIRDLAEKCRGEVTEISSVVEEIESGIRTLTEDIHSDFTNVRQSVEHTRSLEESLGRINATFMRMREQISGILEASESQSLLAAGTSDKITKIELNSELVNTGFNDVYDSIKKQKKSMDGLNTLGKYLLTSANEMSSIFKCAGRCETFDSAEIERTSAEVFAFLNREVLSDEKFALLDPELHRPMLDRLLTHEII